MSSQPAKYRPVAVVGSDPPIYVLPTASSGWPPDNHQFRRGPLPLKVRDPGITAAVCRLSHCDLLAEDADPYCRVHALRWRNDGCRAHPEFEAVVIDSGDPRWDFRRLPVQLKLELQYGLQRGPRTRPWEMRPLRRLPDPAVTPQRGNHAARPQRRRVAGAVPRQKSSTSSTERPPMSSSASSSRSWPICWTAKAGPTNTRATCGSCTGWATPRPRPAGSSTSPTSANAAGRDRETVAALAAHRGGEVGRHGPVRLARAATPFDFLTSTGQAQYSIRS